MASYLFAPGHNGTRLDAPKPRKSQEPVTPVVFRKWHTHGAGDGVIAILGGCECTYGRAMMYEHVGEHGEGNVGTVTGKSRPATPAEYADLKRELERRGYRLKVYKRWQRSFYNWPRS